MVSFQCHACGDVVKKPKLDQHRGRCHAGFDCIDCHTTFNGPTEYKSHTKCITEAEKYQKGLYKGPKSNATGATVQQNNPPQRHSWRNRDSQHNRGIGYTNGNAARPSWMRGGPSGANDTPLGSPVRMSPVTAPSPPALAEEAHNDPKPSAPGIITKNPTMVPVQEPRGIEVAEKSRKKRKRHEEPVTENDGVVNDTDITAARKKHKKKKRESGVADDGIGTTDPLPTEDALPLEPIDKKHKKKKHGSASVPTEDAPVSLVNTSDKKEPIGEKDRKKKKRESIPGTVENVTVSLPEASVVQTEKPSEPIDKKHKKKKRESVSVSTKDVTALLPETSVIQSEKKSKKRKDHESGTDGVKAIGINGASAESSVVVGKASTIEVSDKEHKKNKKRSSMVNAENISEAPARSEEVTEKKRKKKTLEPAIVAAEANMSNGVRNGEVIGSIPSAVAPSDGAAAVQPAERKHKKTKRRESAAGDDLEATNTDKPKKKVVKFSEGDGEKDTISTVEDRNIETVDTLSKKDRKEKKKSNEAKKTQNHSVAETDGDAMKDAAERMDEEQAHGEIKHKKRKVDEKEEMDARELSREEKKGKKNKYAEAGDEGEETKALKKKRKMGKADDATGQRT